MKSIKLIIIDKRILLDIIPMMNMLKRISMLAIAKMNMRDLCKMRTVRIYSIDNIIEQEMPMATIHKY